MGFGSSRIDEAARRDQVLRFLRADPDLVSEVQRHAARIVRFRGYYIPESDRLEIVQEVMVQLWQALAVKQLALSGTLLALTETIACRRCVDWMRRHRSVEPVDEAIPDRGRRPDEALLARERSDLGRRVLASLGEPCIGLIRQVLDEGKPYAEIARAQGRSEHALRTRMWQCLKEAREILRRLTADPAGRLDAEAER
jgi:RNA polymerase sigma factor (sigma-70 family)